PRPPRHPDPAGRRCFAQRCAAPTRQRPEPAVVHGRRSQGRRGRGPQLAGTVPATAGACSGEGAMTTQERPLRRTVQVLRPHLRRRRLLVVLGLVALLADVSFRVLEPWPLKFAVGAVARSLGADIAATTGISQNTAVVLVLSAGALLVVIAGRAATN